MAKMAGVEDWFMLFAGIVMLLAFLTILMFGRMTLAPMEKKLKREGHPRPCPWDGPGARIVWYAYAIGLPVGRFNRVDDPMIDVGLVRQYATAADRVRAIVLLVSGNFFLLVLLVGVVAFDI